MKIFWILAINSAKRRVCPGAAVGQPGGHAEEPRGHRGVLPSKCPFLNLLLAADFGEAQGIGERVRIIQHRVAAELGPDGLCLFLLLRQLVTRDRYSETASCCLILRVSGKSSGAE